MSLDSLWYEKYRPQTLKQYVFQNSHHRKAFSDMVTTHTIPHLLLAGGPGTGKSALSKILIDACLNPDDQPIDLLKLNASDNNSVDDVRQQVYSHITSMGISAFKIVWLEEADYLSPNAQGILRNYMEEYESTCRFIITCNAVHKIIPAIKSRCQQYMFSACDKNDVLEMAATILDSENVKVDSLDTLEKHIDMHYPDMRSIINSLEQHGKDGVLADPNAETPLQSVKLEIIEFIKKDDWKSLQRQLCATIVDEEWEEIYEHLYTNLHLSPKFKKQDLWEQGIVLIAEHLASHTYHAKPNINGASLLIQLGGIA
jgi:DNA polymerase III delta prime subunit